MMRRNKVYAESSKTSDASLDNKAGDSIGLAEVPEGQLMVKFAIAVECTLLKAHIDRGELEEALRILHRLQSSFDFSEIRAEQLEVFFFA